MIVVTAQTLLSPRQSWHRPVSVHGAFAPFLRRCSGAITFLMRSRASSRFFTILFAPTTRIVTGCPQNMPATLLPAPSTLPLLPSPARDPQYQTSHPKELFRVSSPVLRQNFRLPTL